MSPPFRDLAVTTPLTLTPTLTPPDRTLSPRRDRPPGDRDDDDDEDEEEEENADDEP
jgi:hypothetical protein